MEFIRASNGQMAIIYKAEAPDGVVYIGSTTQSIKRRTYEHKCHSTKTSSFGKMKRNFKFSEIKFQIIEECFNSKRYIAEQKWIDFFRSKKICSNQSNAGVGAIGIKRPKHCVFIAKKQMKKRWAKNRKAMLKRVNAHKTKEFQSKSGKLGAAARLALMGKIRVFKNKKLIKEFIHCGELGLFLGVHPSTANKYLLGKTKHKEFSFTRG